ncbi:MAG: class II fructose-1,6-bisphosphate aldolase [Limnochordia bacterium]|nr:class II fructose-1,6-bisphosphate aldolase [Limnochordia bacterium]MDD2628778.1 class II fructose-1,6-bisphosphate aldolase [Limnochordia bacterium]MDD4517741.1 class II fructose-1,6-bisphosphate aldolase [Limnochordia bacterium]
MGLVTVGELVKDAQLRGYAVGAFNLNNLEILHAIVQAAEEEKAPVILQASQGGLKYAGLDYIVAMAKVAAKQASVPVALNLDHGTSFEQAVKCIRAGFSAVMIDGSHWSFKENIELTRKVVEVAHPSGVSVEGELGRIGGTEDDISVSDKDAIYTDPDEAVTFVEITGVDALAVAVGTAHGVYKGVPKLDFERLADIRARVEVPLVLHGASGVPDESIQRAVQIGITKINIDTELRVAFSQTLKKYLEENPDVIDPRKIIGPSRDSMREVVRSKMKLFGCSGKA